MFQQRHQRLQEGWIRKQKDASCTPKHVQRRILWFTCGSVRLSNSMCSGAQQDGIVLTYRARAGLDPTLRPPEKMYNLPHRLVLPMPNLWPVECTTVIDRHQRLDILSTCSWPHKHGHRHIRGRATHPTPPTWQNVAGLRSEPLVPGRKD